MCNSCGQVGYVPERYVQFLCLPAEGASHLEGSFSSILSSGTKERAGSRGVTTLITPQVIFKMSCACVFFIQFDLNPVLGVVRALYSYQAQSAEELSFQEGALIHLIRCRHAEVSALCTSEGPRPQRKAVLFFILTNNLCRLQNPTIHCVQKMSSLLG